MSTQRFEGASLEAVLEDVRHTIGPDARIIAANKLRRGGIAGFFARVTFEVLVEVDDGAAEAPSTRRRRERPLVAERAAPHQTVPTSLLDLADQVSSQERIEASHVSTEGSGFADVLARIARDTGVAVPRTGHAEGASLEAHAEPADELVDLSDLSDLADPIVLPDEPTFEPDPWAYDHRGAPTAAASPMPVAPTPPAPVAPVPVAPVAVAPVPVATAAPAPMAAPPARRMSDRLAAVGVPDYLVQPGHDGDVSAALISALQNLPRPAPLPTTQGSVVAVVGERDAAMAMARSVSEELNLNPDDVVLASSRSRSKRVPEERRIESPEIAADRRRGWYRRRRPTVVAIDAPLARKPGRFASSVLEALEPSATWAVVDAWRKPEDVGAWTEAIGGVDAIALEGTGDTTSPAAILRLGIPVGRVDGRPASASLWTALLVERIEA